MSVNMIKEYVIPMSAISTDWLRLVVFHVTFNNCASQFLLIRENHIDVIVLKI